MSYSLNLAKGSNSITISYLSISCRLDLLIFRLPPCYLNCPVPSSEDSAVSILILTKGQYSTRNFISTTLTRNLTSPESQKWWNYVFGFSTKRSNITHKDETCLDRLSEDSEEGRQPSPLTTSRLSIVYSKPVGKEMHSKQCVIFSIS